MNESKWSFFRISMVVLSSLFILARISTIQFMVQYLGMPVLQQLLLPLLIEILLLFLLIFAPSKYRFLAIIPLLYFVVINLVRMIGFIDAHISVPSIFVFQYIASSLLIIIAYLSFSIILLPFFNYKKKYAIFFGLFLIPALILYMITVIMNMGNMFNQNPFLFIYRSVLINFVASTTIYLVFTLYILEHSKKRQVNDQSLVENRF
ncbi:MAG: hypothetical protein Q7I99_06350 [Acholeplasmataceae bacterium]|nr:hypothetical protein [Acholeplasmataceae bacterium]